MAKKPLHEMTTEELAALPLYEPDIVLPVTAEDRASGRYPHGIWKQVPNPSAPKLIARWHDPRDPVAVRVGNTVFDFVEDTEGNYYRQASSVFPI